MHQRQQHQQQQQPCTPLTFHGARSRTHVCSQSRFTSFEILTDDFARPLSPPSNAADLRKSAAKLQLLCVYVNCVRLLLSRDMHADTHRYRTYTTVKSSDVRAHMYIYESFRDLVFSLAALFRARAIWVMENL